MTTCLELNGSIVTVEGNGDASISATDNAGHATANQDVPAAELAIDELKEKPDPNMYLRASRHRRPRTVPRHVSLSPGRHDGDHRDLSRQRVLYDVDKF